MGLVFQFAAELFGEEAEVIWKALEAYQSNCMSMEIMADRGHHGLTKEDAAEYKRHQELAKIAQHKIHLASIGIDYDKEANALVNGRLAVVPRANAPVSQPKKVVTTKPKSADKVMIGVYSGRCTAHAHKFGNWKRKSLKGVPEAIQNRFVLEAQWTLCPVEVEAEVKKLWRDHEYGNDHCYHSWYWEENSERYPIIANYLKEKGIEPGVPVLIHWWW